MESRKKSEGEDGINRIISGFNDFSKGEKIYLISRFIEELKKFHNLSEDEILGKSETSFPIGIFSTDPLSSLEAIVKYLKENLQLKFSKIGKLLNRSNKTIWATYHNASRKMPSSFDDVSREIMIPVSAISNRKFSTLESVVGFIKDREHTNHEVAVMLHLDDRTIWAVYDKVKKKRGMKA